MRTLRVQLLLAVALAGCLRVSAQQPTPLLNQPAPKLIEILKSDASQKDKADACRELSVIGSKDAVPVLASLLADEKLSHMARFALETIPDPTADQALRSALAQLKGRLLAGVIGSIGVRKDPQAVPDLAKLLSDADTDVAQTAARSLGNIGNAPAVEALKASVGTVPAQNRLAVCEGLLRAAEGLQVKGDAKQAASIYDQLRQVPDAPHQVRSAALRGAILSRGKDGVAVLRDSLQSQEYLLFAAAVRTSYEAPGGDVTKALATELGRTTQEDRCIVLIQALAKRTEGAALTALSTAAKQGAKPVRLAAIRALAETGKPAAASPLVELLAGTDRELSQAALDGLAGLPGKEVDATVQALLKDREAARRLAGIELIGRRRMVGNLPQLLKAATDADAQVRPAALSKVGELGSPSDVGAVLDLLPKLTAAPELEAAEQALGLLCAKGENPQACTDTLTARLPKLAPTQKGVVLRVLSTVGGPAALQTVRAAVNDSDPAVHSAAIRALGAWKTADAAPDLLAIAKSSSNLTDQTLSLRSYLGLAANSDVPAAQRLTLCREASGVVKSNDEKRLLLSALGTLDSVDSIALITPYLTDLGAKDEAGTAIAAIAERLLKGQPSPEVISSLTPPLQKIAQGQNQELAKKAKALLERAQKKAAAK